jgi:autotransporter-associated beta strand protein
MGIASTFSGVISNDTLGVAGGLTIVNSGSANQGAVTFSGINTYTGATTISPGSTLALSGSGSISASSGVVDNGIFDISGTSSGASIKSLTGAGAGALG